MLTYGFSLVGLKPRVLGERSPTNLPDGWHDSIYLTGSVTLADVTLLHTRLRATVDTWIRECTKAEVTP
jgi:hypothetical protein